ncbi:hypothetical protein IV500_06105 [Paeniglutamicibacter antarcticus]|uniref:Uncharacterized protein n=1 Tax=Arthrobacter terrae TaxID=2935737 RepID=A0A931CN67_9MICC|nr:hypothetical protein [Arthrobacter terrae]MBG0738996.1 hypothetical protein [Arthrobacter terrae]
MSISPCRQPEGIPTGGQFAPDTRAEPTVSLTPAASLPPINATVVLQKLVGDTDENVGEVTFDARRVLAAMTAAERDALSDSSYEADEVFHAGARLGLVPDHDGPFEVYVRDAMDAAVEKDPEVFEKIAALPDNRPADAVLHTPLSPYEIGARVNEDGWVSGLATMDMFDLVTNDLEGYNDKIGNDLVGSELLMQQEATPVAVLEGGTLLMRLEGDVSAIIDCFDEDELADYEAGRAEAASAL